MAQARAKVLEEQRAKNQMKGLSKESAIGMNILLTKISVIEMKFKQ